VECKFDSYEVVKQIKLVIVYDFQIAVTLKMYSVTIYYVKLFVKIQLNGFI